MANLAKLKRRNSLGEPPSIDEASQNLQAPEVAPAVAPMTAEPEAAPVVVPLSQAVRLSKEDAEQDDIAPAPSPRQRRRLDGRSLRKTGRILQFATRVSWEFDDKLRRIARRDGLKLVEVLERALDAYEEARK